MIDPRRLVLASSITFALACGDDDAAVTDEGGSAGPGGDAPQSSSGTADATSHAASTGNPADSGPDPSTSSTGLPATTSSDSTETGEDDCLGFDDNGVAQLYCTDPAGAPPWVLGFADWEDRIAQFGDISGAAADTIVEQSGQVRMTVTAEDFDCEGLEDHALALEQGWMCSPLDWTDYEMTGYFQLVVAAADDSNQDLTMYGGGGRHTGDGPPEGCWGTSYKGSVHSITGEVRIGKESWHVNYDWHDWKPVDGGVDLSQAPERWIGMKVVRYRFERDGAAGMRNEIWLDLAGIDDSGVPTNDWQLATASEDHPDQPSWGTQATACNAPVDDQIMFWGGPWVTWRWDETTARLRLMSVREIIAPR